MSRLFCVIPCYNEQEVLPETSKRLREKLESLIKNGKISDDSRIVFVNDGSKDDTWNIIEKLHQENPIFQGINLSKNMGHQNALLAGLMTAKDLCDAAISMDADLQDDINAIDEMVDKFNDGADVVYGVRSSRASDTFFKRFTAESYYKLVNALGAKTVYNHADFRLMSRRALLGLSEFGEVNLFLRGIVPMVGYRSETVYYERAERFAGESKYPLKKMLSFAVEGITSLSTKPIKLITGLGFFIFFVSILVFIYSLIRHFTGHTIPGWTTTVLSVWAIGGLMMISQGIIGEYIGKIYLETKNRPRFIIEKYLADEKDEKVFESCDHR
ncbi:glycosyltransferase family 2 protein [Butyrivibrio sp. YAB3001]|uniref:glycosyltransferase family 2 protein n=1 Tax=Butyrivibrio sp. YAB3001 TaxID=1520812 RepID=UPI0008F66371|nr:glycosyltransferase family 2 protein [Butyrivibrio sp. YAB3001]SFC35555.1 Glycosyltransferase involved in cell wall bisynthesis [Butyrivibrio sp. YAB3001]